MPLSIAFPKIDESTVFTEPAKCINTEADVVTFHESTAYARITAFIHLIADAMQETNLESPPPDPSPTITTLMEILGVCEDWIERCPPHTGARRFGNLAFRDWHARLEAESGSLVRLILLRGGLSEDLAESAALEIVPYFTGSFGSAQRLDYGTGHELSFFAFLCTLFQLDGFLSTESREDAQGIGLLVFPIYLRIIQRLVVTYTLEPAGSHGVWGLDDHFAMPYLLGASQISLLEPEALPTPASITTKRDVMEFKRQNLYFNAIAFINDVKRGPFWEHSPMLYDISGINSWAKISLGMRKMYNAEVLGKFPVVQHFPFGSCFFPFTSISDPSRQLATTTRDQTMNDALADLKQVQSQTSSMHVSEMAKEREALDADTPLPSDHPTRSLRSPKSSAQAPDSFKVPTAAPWKTKTAQLPPTTAPWKTGSTMRPMSYTNQMSSTREPMVPHPLHPHPATPRHSSSHSSEINAAKDASSPQPAGNSKRRAGLEGQDEEVANVEGFVEGIGVQGLPGTKAPFAGERAIHPAVLESMRRRSER